MLITNMTYAHSNPNELINGAIITTAIGNIHQDNSSLFEELIAMNVLATNILLSHNELQVLNWMLNEKFVMNLRERIKLDPAYYEFTCISKLSNYNMRRKTMQLPIKQLDEYGNFYLSFMMTYKYNPLYNRYMFPNSLFTLKTSSSIETLTNTYKPAHKNNHYEYYSLDELIYKSGYKHKKDRPC